jgi:ATP-dependent DNA ligase
MTLHEHRRFMSTVVNIPAPMQAPEQLRQPFTDVDWLYEIKLDGYRVMAGVEAD